MKALLKVGLGALLVLAPANIWAEVTLPESFESWKSPRVTHFASGDFDRLAASDADILREYSAVGGERREYVKGGHRLIITLYQFRDSSGAYGMFTFWRTPEMHTIQIAEARVAGAAAEESRLLASVGNCLVDVRGQGLRGLIEIDLRNLLSRLARSTGENAPLPTLPSYLPKVGLLVNSDRYLLGATALERIRPMKLGDWVGFAYSAEGELGRYQLGDQSATLLLLLYPTPQIATERSKDFARYFAVNEEKPKGNLPPAFLKRTGPLVALVLDTSSTDVASFLLDRIDFRWEVTWSERPSKKDEPGMLRIIVGIFVGTGLLLIVCLLVSVAFGGFRLLVKQLLPGKVFDRPSATEIIQLHLDRR